MKRLFMDVTPASALGARLAACAIAAAAGLASFAAHGQTPDNTKPGAASPKPALTVYLTQPRPSTLPVKLSANGSIAAWQDIIVGAEVSGLRVLELHAAVGDRVSQGQLLASFAAESVQADVALARAALAEAQANAAEAVANADRARSVQGTGALSAQQVNQYLTGEQTARARVESAKAQLDTQLLRLKHTQLLAPDSGLISARTAAVGSVVGAGDEMFRLIRQSRLEWRGEVTSAELERIKPGTQVLVTSPSGAQRKGRVRTLAPTVDAATRKGVVYVDLPVAGNGAQESAFKPGMYARGDFVLGSSSALTVPQSAVVVRDGFSYVYRVGDDKRVSQLKVQTGRLLGEQMEIVSGVTPADRLAATGGSFLSDGDTVRVVDAPAALK